MLVHVVADFGPAGDMAVAEVTRRLAAALHGATIVAIPVGPFDTLAAGLWSRNSRSRSVRPSASCSNVAPRRDYGNLKTTLDERPAANGERVLVRIGDASATAIVSDGSFSVAEGELALAPGSSGWPLREGGERRFIELFLRGGSASARLGRPASGALIGISRT